MTFSVALWTYQSDAGVGGGFKYHQPLARGVIDSKKVNRYIIKIVLNCSKLPEGNKY